MSHQKEHYLPKVPYLPQTINSQDEQTISKTSIKFPSNLFYSTCKITRIPPNSNSIIVRKQRMRVIMRLQRLQQTKFPLRIPRGLALISIREMDICLQLCLPAALVQEIAYRGAEFRECWDGGGAEGEAVYLSVGDTC